MKFFELTLAFLFALTFKIVAATHYVDLNNPNPIPPYTAWATAATNIQHAIDVAEAGDDIIVSNGVYATGGITVQGALTNRVAVTKALSVRSFNGPAVTVISGYQTSSLTNGPDAVRCVYLVNGALLSGFTLTNGATDAVGGTWDGAGGALWCESTNAVITNCVMVGNSAWDSGGAAYSGTLIDCVLSENTCFGAGGGASDSILIRCQITRNTSVSDGGGAVWSQLYDSVVLTNFSGNAGGGVKYCAAVNCTFQGNTARTGGGASGDLDFILPIKNCVFRYNFATDFGGGVASSKLEGCFLIENVAEIAGGGAHISWLTNCLLVGNTASVAGGAAGYALQNCTVVDNVATVQVGGGTAAFIKNCVIYNNTAPDQSNYDALDKLDNCCTEPMPLSGTANFTNAPLFIDAAARNFRLQSNSPCINAGSSSMATSALDLSDNPRVAGGTIDVGAYEFQSPASLLSYAWAQKNGLSVDGVADFGDPDADGANNYAEWRADTIPTNSVSTLRMLSVTSGPVGAEIVWQSVATRNYWLERSTNLIAAPFQTIATNIAGLSGLKSFMDTTATNGGPYFYRVGVQ